MVNITAAYIDMGMHAQQLYFYCFSKKRWAKNALALDTGVLELGLETT